MIKLLIADDHAVVREGLKRILAETPDLVVAGEAGDGQEALDRVRAEAWDMVLLDISLPGMSGLDALKQLKRERPRLPVLVLSIYPEDQYAVRVLKAGASGYLTKDSAPDQLIAAIRKISLGRKFVSPYLAEKLAVDLATDTERPLHERLSDREYQVLCLIASGKTVKEIAAGLSLSVKTVSTYRIRILKKMNVKSNAELIHYALQRGLAE
ncbi:MAG: DNA-binding response regulator [Candidatus Handelsmanbacteria bacterium RIFCSPLOWO2_12_FULL_64_10]|uniref:DNA-binding response regulator n=1 Tax=Handelsmanbacteria sp. (strain RIFCSPLOWO2_12_FULL_64_10) TaxID=1817868 RepID=A0A1F6CBT6_HANXR|nr:MAG: DNA-binding response regulator [Candidatus Handelsmanbacteria bacterium RIFCSPLOWO2_12_FULL_64_10]